MEMVRLKVDLLRKGEYCGNGELGAESAYQVDTCGQRHGVSQKVLVSDSVDPLGGEDIETQLLVKKKIHLCIYTHIHKKQLYRDVSHSIQLI